MREEGKKVYDLEERTLQFSKRIITLINALPKNDINRTLGNQCVRSGTSVGANYREANDAIGDKDFLMRLRISRKEAKETKYWLELIIMNNPELTSRMAPLLQENEELIKILSKIISNRTHKA
jgi:four helix bundle protein